MSVSQNAKSFRVIDDPMSGKLSVAAEVSPGYNDPACSWKTTAGATCTYPPDV